jgi:CelD/BcsL family acetyltransferase involved in cellulose biosynthesis
LLDSSIHDPRVVDLLAAGFSALPWPLLWLDGVNPAAPGWQRVLAAIDRAGLAHEFQEAYRVGLVDIGRDWQTYEASLSRNHRKNMRKARQRLEQAGPMRVVVEDQISPEQIEPLLRRTFEIEDRSWKGPAGTSVLRSPGIFEFFLAQARQLAAWSQLEVGFLELAGQAIAFEYGYRAKGVAFSHKVSYDERFAAQSPGQLLMLEMLRRFHADAEIQLLDCLGPLSDAVGRWTTRTYSLGRLIISPPRFWSRALLETYHLAQPWARKVRERLQKNPA